MRSLSMSLEEKINSDYIQAMKARASDRSGALNFLRAQIKNVKIDKRVEKVSDEDVIAIIKKQIKQRLDSINQFRAGNREDLAIKEEAEIVIYKPYLPVEMSPDQIKVVIEEVVAQAGSVSVKDMGRIMKDVLAKLGGQADNQVVSQLVKERLGK